MNTLTSIPDISFDPIAFESKHQKAHERTAKRISSRSQSVSKFSKNYKDNPDKITAHSIRNSINPPTKSNDSVAALEVPAFLHEDIHREAANRGLSIGEFLKIILDFFFKSENSRATPRGA